MDVMRQDMIICFLVGPDTYGTRTKSATLADVGVKKSSSAPWRSLKGYYVLKLNKDKDMVRICVSCCWLVFE